MDGLNRIPEVRVRAAARLHAGFLDLNGDLGRRFGSIGITLDRPATVVRVRHAEALSVAGPSAERARRCVERLCETEGFSRRVELTVEEAIPEHAGLGSGTQMDLAVSTALSLLNGRPATARDLARKVERGARSGIGLGAFQQGGVLLDGGRGPGDDPPPVIARADFPEDWRLLLVMHDDDVRGLHGTAEVDAFRRLPPFPAEKAAHLCRLMLMVALPALAERDVNRFGGVIGELQRTVGDHFAPAQGGRFTSPLVADAIGWLESEGIPGVGQSSWGPTGFAIVGGAAEAERLADAARCRWAGEPLKFLVCRGSNTGASIEGADLGAVTV